ncbi:helix-turn-helix domain-containing protein [Streptomyces sp. NPDC048603]|uniref:helix-turn-helix domain-containing protein n=1 Tax=Streptomyces sp. NPDC048603 TaxID=3365577 RepID=UPI00371AAEF4
MPPRTLPTYRQRRLGAELRQLRLSAGLTAEFAAGLLGMDRGKVPNIESGTRTISVERLRILTANYGCTNGPYVSALAAMTGRRKRGWWDRYRDRMPAGLLDIAELEAHASGMRTSLALHIPGLLQTADHALAIFRAGVPALSEQDIALRVAFRLERQEILTGPSAVTYTSLVHEAALRMQFGGAGVAKAQLVALLAHAERENVNLRVIPFTAGAFPGAGQTILYAEGPVPQLDTVQVDSTHGPEFLHEQAQLGKYQAHLDWMERIALSPSDSRDLIRTISKEL